MSIIRFSKIRVLETGYKSAALNMAIDEALIESIDESPVFRVYGCLCRLFSEHKR